MAKTASDFYFRVVKDNEMPNGFYVTITPKKLWNAKGIISDNSFSAIEKILPPDFCELMESAYEYNGTTTQARQALLSAGFIENINLP